MNINVSENPDGENKKVVEESEEAPSSRVDKTESDEKSETANQPKKDESEDENKKKDTDDVDKKKKGTDDEDIKKTDTDDEHKNRTETDKPTNEDNLDEDGRPPVDDTSPSPSMANPNEEDQEECTEGETCPQITKSINEQYMDYRETAKTMIYLIDCRDRARIFKWICKLNTMEDDEGQMERLLYIKYLVQTLSEPYGLVDPFTSYPPDRLKPLRNILAPVVFADLLEEHQDRCFEKRRPEPTKKVDPAYGPVQNDKKFFDQQLFPPEGLMCYAVAFSTL